MKRGPYIIRISNVDECKNIKLNSKKKNNETEDSFKKRSQRYQKASSKDFDCGIFLMIVFLICS